MQKNVPINFVTNHLVMYADNYKLMCFFFCFHLLWKVFMGRVILRLPQKHYNMFWMSAFLSPCMAVRSPFCGHKQQEWNSSDRFPQSFCEGTASSSSFLCLNFSTCHNMPLIDISQICCLFLIHSASWSFLSPLWIHCGLFVKLLNNLFSKTGL